MVDLCRIDISCAAIAHMTLQHCLRKVLHVALFTPTEIELIIDVIDVILFLIPIDPSAPCNEERRPQETGGEEEREGGGGGGFLPFPDHNLFSKMERERAERGRRESPLRRLNLVLHWGQTWLPSRRS